MALRCTASASKRPEEVRKPQQGLAARFKLCGRKPLRGLPPSPRWTWRCALREANVRKGLGGYTRSSGTYLGPSGCANAPRGFVLSFWQQVGGFYGICHFQLRRRLRSTAAVLGRAALLWLVLVDSGWWLGDELPGHRHA